MPWPLPDITPFSHTQKIEVTGASNLTLLFTARCFCLVCGFTLCGGLFKNATDYDYCVTQIFNEGNIDELALRTS